jgi:hypothetical protein
MNWTIITADAPPTYDDDHITLVARKDGPRFEIAVACPDGSAWVGGNYEEDLVISFEFWTMIEKPPC